MMLLPEHFEVMENGVVVFKLESGENLSLTSDQYLILEDGLLLITDELAQASIYTLPVMGSVRAQLLSDLEQVAINDGAMAEATPAQTLSITEGQAPRLSEQVELQSYELAQESACADGSDDERCAMPMDASSEASEGLAVGTSVAPGGMFLMSMLAKTKNTAPEITNNNLDISDQTDIEYVLEAEQGILVLEATDKDGDQLNWTVLKLDKSDVNTTEYNHEYVQYLEIETDNSAPWNGALKFSEPLDYFTGLYSGWWDVTIQVDDGRGGTDEAIVEFFISY